MQVELVNDGPVTIILDTKIDKKTKPAGLVFVYRHSQKRYACCKSLDSFLLGGLPLYNI